MRGKHIRTLDVCATASWIIGLRQRLGKQKIVLPVLFVARLAQSSGYLRPVADAVQHGMPQYFALAGRKRSRAAGLEAYDRLHVFFLRRGQKLFKFLTGIFGNAENLVEI